MQFRNERMRTSRNNINNLHSIAQFVLFVSSYAPLFILIIVRQVSENAKFIYWGGFNWANWLVFSAKFGLSSLLFIVTFLSLIGYRLSIKNIEADAKNGHPVIVTDVKNKSSEAIGYIATYLIPFLFQSFDGWYEPISVLFLMVIIYRIYINSSLILVNPLLSFRFGIYEIEFDENGRSRNGFIISRDKYLKEDSSIKLYEIGHKLYFAINNN